MLPQVVYSTLVYPHHTMIILIIKYSMKHKPISPRKKKHFSCTKRFINEIITGICYLTICLLSPQHIQVWSMQLVFLLNFLVSHPLTRCASQLPYHKLPIQWQEITQTNTDSPLQKMCHSSSSLSLVSCSLLLKNEQVCCVIKWGASLFIYTRLARVKGLHWQGRPLTLGG